MFDIELGEGHSHLVCHPPTKAQKGAPQCFPWRPHHSLDGKCEHKHPGVVEALRAAPAVCFLWLKPKHSQLTNGRKIRRKCVRVEKKKKLGQRTDAKTAIRYGSHFSKVYSFHTHLPPILQSLSLWQPPLAFCSSCSLPWFSSALSFPLGREGKLIKKIFWNRYSSL